MSNIGENKRMLKNNSLASIKNPKTSSMKKTAAALALLLMLTTSIFAVLPSASAHTPAWQIVTHAYISAAPNPVGVTQQTYIIVWLNWLFDNAMTGNPYRFNNYQITITAPDGTTQTKTFPVVFDSTSAQPYAFTPAQVGTYTLKFSFPGQTLTTSNDLPTSAYINDTYLPSSASTTLIVQQTPISTIPATPLPTQYWTRPIYGTNPNWWTISSNWLGAGAPGYGGIGSSPNLGANAEGMFPGDAVGPLTGHVMWTKPLQSGGVVGGNNFAIQGDTYFEGSAYQQRFTNPIIIDGKLYYTEPVSFSGPNSGPTDCVDLQTGRLIWSRTDVPALSFGYIYDVQDPNQHGVYPPILFASAGGGWRAFDADTGNPLFNVTSIPSGTSVFGVNGEILKYALNNYGTSISPNWYLGQWNSSRLWDNQYSGPSTSPAVIPPITNGSDPSLYDWNVSIASINTMRTVTVVGAVYGDTLLCYTGTLPSNGANLFFGALSSTPYTYFAINLNATKGAIGSMLWSKTYDPPPDNVTVLVGGIDPVNRVFIEEHRETNNFVGYSLDTGQKLWGPTDPQQSLDYYGSPGSGSMADTVAYGKIYSSAYGGILYCYDTKTGNLLWTYGNGGEGNSTNAGFETPFGYYPTFVNAIGNGVVYEVTTEHTIETPLFKGALTRAINATTGKEIYTLSAYTGEFLSDSFAIADGYATFFNGYDNQIYVIGRGPSVTTVEAPLTAITLGSSLVVQGTVMDISDGTQQTAQKANFPNGVPCASDASMKDWMGYVYQQQPCPTNFAGVPVTLTAFDPNNNTEVIGTVTSDGRGSFSVMWTPPVPGKYTIIATFAGSNAYYGSSAETAIGVSPAAHPSATTPPPTTTAVPPSTTTPAPTSAVSPSVAPTPTPPASSAASSTTLYIVAAAAVIIIVIAAAAVMLRRRK